MTYFSRIEYNKSLLEKCLDLLRSRNQPDRYEGVTLAAYLIEQTFKFYLKELNPLLYFERKSSEEPEIKIVTGILTDEEIKSFATVKAQRCIAYICIYKPDLAPYRHNLEELFEIRNYIIHSVDDFLYDSVSATETAVSALRFCRDYVASYLGISQHELNPLTSEDFERFQSEEREKKIKVILDNIRDHRKIYKHLSEDKVQERIDTNLVETDEMMWVEETVECPACNQISLDKIVTVDFDWNPDGVLELSGHHYLCRVCELELSSYEYDIAVDSF